MTAEQDRAAEADGDGYKAVVIRWDGDGNHATREVTGATQAEAEEKARAELADMGKDLSTGDGSGFEVTVKPAAADSENSVDEKKVEAAAEQQDADSQEADDKSDGTGLLATVLIVGVAAEVVGLVETAAARPQVDESQDVDEETYQ